MGTVQGGLGHASIATTNLYLRHLGALADRAGLERLTLGGTPGAHERRRGQNDKGRPAQPRAFALVRRGLRRVELRGFEPLTFSLRTRRATNCATAPRCGRNCNTAAARSTNQAQARPARITVSPVSTGGSPPQRSLRAPAGTAPSAASPCWGARSRSSPARPVHGGPPPRWSTAPRPPAGRNRSDPSGVLALHPQLRPRARRREVDNRRHGGRRDGRERESEGRSGRGRQRRPGRLSNARERVPAEATDHQGRGSGSGRDEPGARPGSRLSRKRGHERCGRVRAEHLLVLERPHREHLVRGHLGEQARHTGDLGDRAVTGAALREVLLVLLPVGGRERAEHVCRVPLRVRVAAAHGRVTPFSCSARRRLRSP